MSATYLAQAFRGVVIHDLDRAILLELCSAGKEVRYEDMRRRVGESSPEAFSRAVERLSGHALVKRRLERLRGQERYGSWLSPSPRGTTIASVLEGLASTGRIPSTLPAEVREQVKAIFKAGPPQEARAA